ncbi:MAG: DUF1467 family protein [Paracoccaceae bacterium]
MSATAAIVLYSVIWFLTFFIVLQVTTHTQEEAGSVEPGTPASAPAEETVRRRAWTATLIATGLWVVVTGVILSGAITVRDLDVFGRMGPQTSE